MARSIILLLDSFGIGYAHDAEKFGDSGADTLGHICEWMAANRKSADGSSRYLHLPNLARLDWQVRQSSAVVKSWRIL